jgi:hypothetical protein
MPPPQNTRKWPKTARVRLAGGLPVYFMCMERLAELEHVLRAQTRGSTDNPRSSRREDPKMFSTAQDRVHGKMAEGDNRLEHQKAGAGAAQSLVGAAECYLQKEARMEGSVAELEQMLRAHICRVCSDRWEDGSCGLKNPADCALLRYLPQVVRAVQSTGSTDVTDYVRAIRSQVYFVCPQQAADGSCELREQVRCALDAYLILIVDAIEEATGKQLSRQAAWCGS